MFLLQTLSQGDEPFFLNWHFLAFYSCFHAPYFPHLLLMFSFHFGLFYIFWLLHVLIFNNFLCAVIFNGGAFLVSLVFILNDVVTWVVFPVL